jgi:hypothetical protein
VEENESMADELRRNLRAVVAFPDGDPVCMALSALVNRDLMEAAMHPDEDVGWTPLTIKFARRLRELHHEHEIWEEEPDIIRIILDGVWE